MSVIHAAVADHLRGLERWIDGEHPVPELLFDRDLAVRLPGEGQC